MSKLDIYLESLSRKNVTVLGIGVSNTPLIKLLLSAGANVTARDKKSRQQLSPTADALEILGADLVLGEHYLDNISADVIFRSPGIRCDLPQLVQAVQNGAVLTSEMEVFFQVCPCQIFAVTGSDGKTTTTTIISEMLKKSGKTVWIGGNIGTPLLKHASEMQESDICVIELSSFQLMSMDKSPCRALITNISPNHLDVHRGMEEYVSAKENIFAHQRGDDLLVLNGDCAETLAMADRAPSNVVLFSRAYTPKTGVSLENDIIYYNENGVKQKLFPACDILIAGVHNVENYMAACAMLYGIVPIDTMHLVAQSFGGVEHRQELVRTLDGVNYYNDSIASSPTRTQAALHTFNNIILIAGGYDKHIPFAQLGADICRHVKHLILCGDTAPLIELAVLACANPPPIDKCENYSQALALARNAAKPGDNIFLSPACASFDRFPNFMARGNAFKQLVLQLK